MATVKGHGFSTDFSSWDLCDYECLLKEKLGLKIEDGQVVIDFAGAEGAIKEILEDAFKWMIDDTFTRLDKDGFTLMSGMAGGDEKRWLTVGWGELAGRMDPYEVARHLYFSGHPSDEGWLEHVRDGLKRGLIATEELCGRFSIPPKHLDDWLSGKQLPEERRRLRREMRLLAAQMDKDRKAQRAMDESEAEVFDAAMG